MILSIINYLIVVGFFYSIFNILIRPWFNCYTMKLKHGKKFFNKMKLSKLGEKVLNRYFPILGIQRYWQNSIRKYNDSSKCKFLDF